MVVFDNQKFTGITAVDSLFIPYGERKKINKNENKKKRWIFFIDRSDIEYLQKPQ